MFSYSAVATCCEDGHTWHVRMQKKSVFYVPRHGAEGLPRELILITFLVAIQLIAFYDRRENPAWSRSMDTKCVSSSLSLYRHLYTRIEFVSTCV